MKNSLDRLSIFLQAVENDWRNAIYIDCQNHPCPQKQCCGAVLFAADEDGSPILFPTGEFQQLTGQSVAKEDCHGQLERTAFEAAFRCFINWQTETDGDCALRQILAVQPYPMPLASRTEYTVDP